MGFEKRMRRGFEVDGARLYRKQKEQASGCTDRRCHWIVTDEEEVRAWAGLRMDARMARRARRQRRRTRAGAGQTGYIDRDGLRTR